MGEWLAGRATCRLPPRSERSSCSRAPHAAADGHPGMRLMRARPPALRRASHKPQVRRVPFVDKRPPTPLRTCVLTSSLPPTPCSTGLPGPEPARRTRGRHGAIGRRIRPRRRQCGLPTAHIEPSPADVVLLWFWSMVAQFHAEAAEVGPPPLGGSQEPWASSRAALDACRGRPWPGCTRRRPECSGEIGLALRVPT